MRNVLISMLLMSSTLPAISKAPQVDLRDVAYMIIGHQICHTISLERVATVGKRAAKREGIPFSEAQTLLKGIYTDLVAEIQNDPNPNKINEVCMVIGIMDKQIP